MPLHIIVQYNPRPAALWTTCFLLENCVWEKKCENCTATCGTATRQCTPSIIKQALNGGERCPEITPESIDCPDLPKCPRKQPLHTLREHYWKTPMRLHFARLLGLKCGSSYIRAQIKFYYTRKTKQQGLVQLV